MNHDDFALDAASAPSPAEPGISSNAVSLKSKTNSSRPVDRNLVLARHHHEDLMNDEANETAMTGDGEAPEVPPVSAGMIDVAEVERALAVLLEPGFTTEIVLLNVRPGNTDFTANYSGFYDDPKALLRDLRALGRPWTGAYIRLNPLDPTLLSRGGLAKSRKGESTTDVDVLRRRWLFIDLDPARIGTNGQHIKGIPASEGEFDLACQLAGTILGKLYELGWPDSVVGLSGNGVHLLFRVDLPTASTLVVEFLKVLQSNFASAEVEIDTTVANPSRLTRLYGTANCKGADTSARPFRMSRFDQIPDQLHVVTEAQLRQTIDHLRDLVIARPDATPVALAVPVLTPRAEKRSTASPREPRDFALPLAVTEVLDRAGLTVSQAIEKGDYVVHELEVCACDRKEQGCSVTVSVSGGIGLHCHHASCEYSAAAAKPGTQWRKLKYRHFGTALARTDTDHAELLVTRHGDELRSVPGMGWCCWDGGRWAKDEGEVAVNALAKETARSLVEGLKNVSDEAAKPILANARHCLTAAGRNAMIALSSREPDVVVMAADFDVDPWLLGVANGTIDLRTGVLRPPSRRDLMFMRAPVAYDREATAPLWQRVLDRVLPDPEVQAFVQRFIGYALTGVIREHIIVFLHGSGRNGKSTLIEVLKAVLGDYVVHANPKLLLVRKFDENPVERMTLRGKRLAVCAETGAGRKLAEETVKALTGGDTINARALYKDEVNFAPTHKLMVATNYLPQISGTDEGIWSRIVIVPFNVQIPEGERDTELLEKLRREAAGILAWAVDGCLAWQERGLAPPDRVRQRTAAHRSDSDPVAAFLDECCSFAPDGRVNANDLRERYERWCADSDETPLTQRELGLHLRQRSCSTEKANGKNRWTGIALRTPDSSLPSRFNSTPVPKSTPKKEK